MIECLNVAGTCLIKDGSLTHEAYVGMVLQRTSSPCVIVTGKGSNATLRVNGNLVTLGPQSWLRYRPSVGFPHRLIQKSQHGVRDACGWIWSKIAKDDHWDGDAVAGSSAVGVRG